MSTRRRRFLLLVAVALLATACGSTAPTAPRPSTPGSIEPVVSGSTATPATSADAGQTDTDWGRIWDAVPAGFPRFPGSSPTEDAAAEPVSARSGVPGGDPGAIATWFKDALEQRGFSTVGLNGPAEDGGFVVDSTAAGECRVQTTIAPLGDMTFIAVRYGAWCPAP